MEDNNRIPAPAAAPGNPDGRQPSENAPEPKPFLGDPKPGDGQQPSENAPEPKPFLGDPKPGDGGSTPTAAEDYEKALVKDEALLGNDGRIQLDAELYKACIPVMQKYGVPPEAANALANALAKAQLDDAKARMADRLDYFNRMKQESLRTYTPADFETINAGIDHWFKPGGVMNAVIRNSELGADSEFLALMHHLGKAAREDGAAGAANGGGTATGDPNGIDGLSKMW